jgi:glyoxylate reductase
VLTETTADLVWALILSTARRIVEGAETIKQDRWTTWSPMFLTGYDVFGATLGIVGAGRIGAAVARRAQGFKMPIIYHNRRPAPALEAETGAQHSPLDDLLREADIVVVQVPLGDATRGMFGAREFALMKPTSIFINASRGAVVKELELVEALKAGRPWAAGLDVFEREPIRSDHPLTRLPNATIVPHIGSATVRTRTLMATTAARNLVAALTGVTPPNPVNPEVLPLARPGA